jgi:hypothetical protein
MELRELTLTDPRHGGNEGHVEATGGEEEKPIGEARHVGVRNRKQDDEADCCNRQPDQYDRGSLVPPIGQDRGCCRDDQSADINRDCEELL